MRQTKGIIFVFICLMSFVFVGTSSITTVKASGVPDTFDPNTIIDDSSFIAYNSMSANEIQSFLSDHGSGLASFSENGKTAAQIIWGASHAQGDGTGSINGITIDSSTGTVSPKVLLVTLQKEQSLISTANPSQSALNTAMGYGCPDSGGCNAAYQGFTKQVENAAWQLRYNYERATRGFSDYQVGQTMTFSNTLTPYNPPATQSVTISNSATASLYRYTPHVYNGNYNFWRTFRQWFSRWQASAGAKTGDVSMARGESAKFAISIENTGEETWQQSVVHLATTSPTDRIPRFIREDKANNNSSGWVSANRIQMVESSVAPGQTATFRFYYTAPNDLPLGTYQESFGLVADGVTWIDFSTTWNVNVLDTANSFKAAVISRSNNPTVLQGKSAVFEAKFQNTGYVTWRQGTVNLGTDRGMDRIPRFIREDVVNHNPSGWLTPNRVQLVESSVAPGETGTFRFYYTVPEDLPSGIYREYFRPVYEGVTWLNDRTLDFSWDVIVPSREMSTLSTRWSSQNSYPTLKNGQSYQFELKMVNTSLTTWKQGEVNLGTDRGTDRIPRFIREDVVNHNPSGWLTANRISMVEPSVAPGETATFRFYYSVPNDLPTGTYREYFRPVYDGVGWMTDWGIYWDITVQ